MISWMIKTEVCVIRLRQITFSYKVLIIHDIMQKPNSIIVLLYIFHIIHPQKQKWSVQPFCFWGEHSKGLSNQADVELDMIKMQYLQQILHLSCQVHKLLWIDWMLSTNQIFHSELWCIIIIIINLPFLTRCGFSKAQTITDNAREEYII